MKISVIVPIYNVEKYLSRCIDSILQQIYSDIEVILINDGSPDNCLNICKEYAERDSRIFLIDQKNKGLSGARNTGLRISKGEFVCFIDSDDAIESDMIKEYVKTAQTFYPDVITTNILQYEKGNKSFRQLRNELPYNTLLNRDEIKMYFIEPYYGGYLGIIPSACTKLYRRTFLTENSLYFDETLKRSEDYWFNFYAFKTARKVYAIDKAFYHYYTNEGSMIRSFRVNQFEVYLANRNRLLAENNELKCTLNWGVLNSDFTNNINELILLAINTRGVRKSYDFVNNIIMNNEFREIILNTSSVKPHVRLIQKLITKNQNFAVFITYYLWSFKAK